MPSSSLPSHPTSSQRWFYLSHEGEEQGPLDYRELRFRALQGKVIKDTVIWQTEKPTRIPASEYEGLLPMGEPMTDLPEDEGMNKKSPYEMPRRRTILDGPPGGLYLPYLKPAAFSVLLALLTGFVGLAYASWMAKTQDLRLPLLSFAALALIAFVILSMIYLHRAWEMLRVVGAPIPGKRAVMMMIFPILNAFMSFQVILKWSAFWNYQVDHHPGLSNGGKVWRLVPFLFCLGFFASQVLLIYHGMTGEWPHDPEKLKHQISLGTLGITLFLGLAVWAQFCRKINFLGKKKV